MRVILIISAMIFVMLVGACSKTSPPNISIENARLRLPAPGQTTAAGFFDIVNMGGADTLLSASSTISGHIELHTHLHEDGIMKMRKVETVDVAAKQMTQFKPRSFHLMIFNVDIPKDAAHVQLILVFAKSGEVKIDMKVGTDMKHGKMQH